MMLVESGVFLKNYVVIYAEILHHRFIRQFTKFLNQTFYLSIANENLETFIQV